MPAWTCLPLILLLDVAEFVPRALQLLLKALDADDGLQQVLVEVGVLFLQNPAHTEMMEACKCRPEQAFRIYNQTSCGQVPTDHIDDNVPPSFCATFYILLMS